jgi:DNA-directed RNA polymerase specialized sigma24 family protein
MATPARGGRFQTTRWSVVLAAGHSPTTESRAALTTLCEGYWYPLYAFLRRQGHSADEAQDLTQGFFARVLEKGWLADVDPARGRFRSFLLASLTHYASNERDRARALKRGGPVPPLPLDIETAEGLYQLEPRDDLTPEHIFDRRWALTLLDRALARLRDECHARGKGNQFDALKEYLGGDRAGESYAAAGLSLDMSEGAVKVAVHRLRRRFRDLLRDEIAETVQTADQVEDELRHLFRSLGRP